MWEDRWTPLGFWQALDPLCKATALVLAIMLVHALFVLTTRLFRYAMACWHGRPILRLLATQQFKIGELLDVAKAYKNTHIAPVVLTGIHAFQSAPSQFTHREAVTSADRAMRRCESKVHAEMKLGVSTLATITAIAPFVGLLGTVVGIFFSFGGSSMQRSALLAFTSESIARALALTAASLAVAIFALWSYNFLTRRVEVLDVQIAAATLHFITYLNDQPREHLATSAGAPVTEGLLTGSDRAEIPYERGRLLLPYLWMLWLYFVYAIARALYWHFHD